MCDSLERQAPQSFSKTTDLRIVVLRLERRNQIAADGAGDRGIQVAFARGKSTCFDP
jgi:hypothetical protein